MSWHSYVLYVLCFVCLIWCPSQEIIEEEEVSFNRTLQGGLKHFDKVRARLAAEGSTVVPGEDVWIVVATLVFPPQCLLRVRPILAGVLPV